MPPAIIADDSELVVSNRNSFPDSRMNLIELSIRVLLF